MMLGLLIIVVPFADYFLDLICSARDPTHTPQENKDHHHQTPCNIMIRRDRGLVILKSVMQRHMVRTSHGGIIHNFVRHTHRDKWDLTHRDEVILVRMNSNKVNSLSREFISDFHEAMDTLERNTDQFPSHCPLILTSHSESTFSAGLDLGYVLRLEGEEKAQHRERIKSYVKEASDMFERLYLCNRPTVAAIGGHAIAGGFILAICCDFRVVLHDTKGKMMLREIALGINFPSVILQILRQELPPPVLQEAVLTGSIYTLPDAFRYGIAHAEGKTMDEVLDSCRDIICERLPQGTAVSKAYGILKNQLKRPGIDAVKRDDSYRRDDELFLDLLTGEDCQRLVRDILHETKTKKKL